MTIIRLPFLEDCTPPPFYLPNLSTDERTRLDAWFIGKQSQAYYLKRFAQFDKAGKMHARWHWAAFFCTALWLVYRKRYLDCLVYCIAGWSFIKLNIVIILAVCEFLLVSHLPVEIRLWVRVAIGSTVWLFWATQVARWADAYYYRMARREIADAVAYHHTNERQAYLAHHGGVSLWGLSGAFAVILAFVVLVATQVISLISDNKEKSVIYDSYQTAQAVQKRIEYLYQTTGSCPVGLPVSADGQVATVSVVGELDFAKTDCAVVATVVGAGYPVRYLNGRTLVLYRSVQDDKVMWRCQTSLNKFQKPSRCI